MVDNAMAYRTVRVCAAAPHVAGQERIRHALVCIATERRGRAFIESCCLCGRTRPGDRGAAFVQLVDSPKPHGEFGGQIPWGDFWPMFRTERHALGLGMPEVPGPHLVSDYRPWPRAFGRPQLASLSRSPYPQWLPWRTTGTANGWHHCALSLSRQTRHR